MNNHHVPFFLFGMGDRRKFIYRDGILTDSLTGEIVRRWDILMETIVPAEYQVSLVLKNGQGTRVYENEAGIFIDGGNYTETLAQSSLCLPRFGESAHAMILRILHQEILVNIVHGQPLPNLLVYRKPWYRDAALMCMCLQKTGNLHLVKDWIMGLTDVYDRNNAGIAEPDNLGEALYLISLVSDRSHPLVPTILQRAKLHEQGQHIHGLTDFAEHPVYQTKWMKFGLKALGLDDPYEIPAAYDNYSALFWMDYRDRHVAGSGFDERTKKLYPYLGWAEAHFHDAAFPSIPDSTQYPLTWEAEASQADYSGMEKASDEFARQKMAAPHTWHAAEQFLYLLEGV